MGNGEEWETGKNGKHRGTEGTEKRGREEKREERRGVHRMLFRCRSLLDLANFAPLR
jgi:hypothetical protein